MCMGRPYDGLRMRQVILQLCCLACLSLGCRDNSARKAHTPVDYSAQITALKAAVPAEDVAAAVARGDVRFVGVMGDGPVIPGAPQWVSQTEGFARFIP